MRLTERGNTTTSINVAGRVRALREYAVKNGATSKQVAIVLKSDEETVRKVADLKASSEEVAEIAAGLERVAALARQQIEQDAATTATKSSFGGAQVNGEDDNRDALGRSIVKPHGSSPADIRARKEERVSPLDQGDGRDAQGRQLKKVYG